MAGESGFDQQQPVKILVGHDRNGEKHEHTWNETG